MPHIKFLSGPLVTRVLNLETLELSMGRHPKCDLLIPDYRVSTKHAVIRFQDKQWWIYDLNSSNGLYVNGDETDAAILREEDQVTIGESIFSFHLEDSSEGQYVEAFSEETMASGVQASTETSNLSHIAADESVKEKIATPTYVPEPTADLDADDLEIIAELNAAYGRMTEQLGRVIIGQSEVIEQVLVSILCRGHALLMGVPGLAKTLLVSTLSQVLDLSFKRVQFTPDLMPSDITGTDVLEEDQATGKRNFRFVQGPLFSNMVLADEINRTPPKTQAALLEAMQEQVVTIGDRSYHLPAPFFVLATQNPIEQEGTYPLPEAQLDRFMFNIIVNYPTAEEESQIIRQVTGNYKAELEVALGAEELLRLQKVVRRVPAADHVIDLARDLVRATRPKEPDAPDFIKEMVSWGAGPRAGIYLILAAKAFAILNGRYHATSADVFKAAAPVLRHRVLTTFNAEASGVTSDDVIQQLIEYVKAESKIDI